MDFAPYTTQPAERIMAELGTAEIGLEKQEVVRRRRKYGKNEIAAKKVHQWQIFLRQLKSPFIYLLLVAALLALSLNETLDAAMIALFVIISAGLGFLQENHSEKALELLKKYIIRKAHVRRDGEELLLDSGELVPGDIVIVNAGDLIPADIRFFRESNLTVDESILTGESVTVEKTSKNMSKAAKEAYQAKNIGFFGTTVVSGRGEGIVIATGGSTAVGDVAQLTAGTGRESSFEKNVGKISNLILYLISGTLLIVFLLHTLLQQGGTSIGDAAIFFIALAVSVIPEALPVVITFSLARGAMSLAKNKIVVKRLSAIEELGSIEVLCCDKTGTLTENKMAVADVNAADPEEAIFYANLSGSGPWENGKMLNNSFDLAFSDKLSDGGRKRLQGYRKIDEVPFDPLRRYNSVVVEKGNAMEVVARGAPEAILAYTKISRSERDALGEWIALQGRRGRRVLAIAKGQANADSAGDLEKSGADLTLLGLVSLADPIKASVKSTVRKANKLGICIKVLTGDSREVAGVVAHEVGVVDSPEMVMTGPEFAALSDAERSKTVERYAVFARVSPQQKYEIIQLLQENHEVGFLGEGINDAPALKAANVGLVVRGASDVAQEAADIVLLRKSLETIVDGIGEGRKIFANTVKYIKTTLASNFGNFYAVACASLLIPFLPMRPLQILLLNLLSDFPMIAIAADNVDPTELKRPRGYNVREIALFSIILGGVSAIFDFTCFSLFYRAGPQILQTNWFLESVLTELALIISARTKMIFFLGKKPSTILLGLLIPAACGAILLPFTNLGQDVFGFASPTANHLVLILGLVGAYFLTSEGTKLLYYHVMNRNGKR